jgi:glycosyltransferase involved in cell wall biosynthesis
MKLSILVPCLTTRNYQPLISELTQQAVKFPNQAEVLYFIDDGELTSGQKRNALTRDAKGEYIAFVDDDDFISTVYVEQLLKGIESGADIVSFNMIRLTPRFSEVWRLDGDTDTPKSGRMSSNHLCAWKKCIATKVAWSNALGYADDQLWYRPLLHVCKPTRHHIDQMLYTYCFSPEAMSNHDKPKIKTAREYFGTGLRVFTDGGEIFIEERDGSESSPVYVTVRDCHNKVHRRHLGSLIPEFVCRVS